MYISFHMNVPDMAGKGSYQEKTETNADKKRLSFFAAVKKEGQSVFSCNFHPCMGLPANIFQFVKIFYRQIHFIAVMVLQQIPDTDFVISAQIQKPLRAVRLYLNAHIPFAVVFPVLQGATSLIKIKFCRYCRLSSFLHLCSKQSPDGCLLSEFYFVWTAG